DSRRTGRHATPGMEAEDRQTIGALWWGRRLSWSHRSTRPFSGVACWSCLHCVSNCVPVARGHHCPFLHAVARSRFAPCLAWNLVRYRGTTLVVISICRTFSRWLFVGGARFFRVSLLGNPGVFLQGRESLRRSFKHLFLHDGHKIGR